MYSRRFLHARSEHSAVGTEIVRRDHISDVHKQVHLAANFNLDSHDLRRMKLNWEPEIRHRLKHTCPRNAYKTQVRSSSKFHAVMDFDSSSWELQGLTANSRTVPAPQLRLLGSWAPFWADYLASVITRCRYTMLIMMIALLFMCRCGLWVRDLLLFRPLFSLNSSGIWC